MSLKHIQHVDNVSDFAARYKQMMQTLKNTMSMVVESLINKFEEDQLRKEEMDRENLHGPSESHFNDNCSDSDSSFNHVSKSNVSSLMCLCLHAHYFK